MSRTVRTMLLTALSILVLVGASACITVERDDGPSGDDPAPTVTPEPTATPEPTETPVPTPEPEPTPTEPAEVPDDFEYELLHTEKSLPPDTFEAVIDIAFTEEEFEALWDRFGFEEPAPVIDWDESLVIFAGTGESGTCPLELDDVRYDSDGNEVTIEVSEEAGPDVPCTDDWTPRAFVISIPVAEVDARNLTVSLVHGGRGPGEVGQIDFGWYQLVASEKNYPEEEIGEVLLELAESHEELEELWNWFQLEGELPEIDWDAQVVFFAGVGESGTCPLHVDHLQFDEDERFLVLTVAMEDPDAICTADWTPRDFVLSMDTETLGEGELRAAVQHAEVEDSLYPESGEIIREE